MVETKAPPARIWLQTGCDDPECGNDRCQEVHAYHEGVTWCDDQIHENDDAYLRRDLVQPLVDALRKLKGEAWWLAEQARASGRNVHPEGSVMQAVTGADAALAAYDAATPGGTNELVR